MFPKLGVSQDPDFYDETKKDVPDPSGRRHSYYSKVERVTKSYAAKVPNYYNREVKYGGVSIV